MADDKDQQPEGAPEGAEVEEEMKPITFADAMKVFDKQDEKDKE